VSDIDVLTDLNQRFIEAFRIDSWPLLKTILSPDFSYLDGATGVVWPMERYIADLDGHPLSTIDIDQVRIHVERGSWLCVHACVWPLQAG
jgi:hypothetical protein